MGGLRVSAWKERIGRRAWALPGALLVVAALLRLPTLAYPLTERHAFRQTQTAFPAVIYASQGIDLLHAEVPVFGPPWSLPFEFPLVQAIGAPFIAAGVTVEITMRSLSLAGFLATAAVRCNDWTPAPLVYADRRGIILRFDSQVPPPGYVVIGGGLGCTGRSR